MGRFYLIRHAEPELQGVFLGRTDSPLSDRGRTYAAGVLAELHAEVVYCSPLSRSLETAACMTGASRLIILEELSEIDLGEWEARTWAQIEETWPDLARRKSEDWFGVNPPGGESWAAFADRVMQAWAQIQQGPTPAAIVGHLAVNAVLAGHLIGIDPASFRQGYCEVLAVEK